MRVTIDGNQYDAPEGQTILEIAKENGIKIPSLCYHVKTGQAGKCRACVVEVEGMKGLQTSCTVKAKEGMKILTATDKVRDAQRLVIDLLLSSGRHDCLSCEKNGECELQEAAYFLGIERPSFKLGEKIQPDNSSEFIIRDNEKCIKCGRCIEGCNNTVVNEVLSFGYRSNDTAVVCDDDILMGESSCVQCGECSQLCPVGAIIDRNSIGKGRPWERKQTNTVCAYCGVGCQLTLHTSGNRVVKVTGVEGAPCNDGMLCVKGRYGYDFVNSKERLTVPLIRDEKTKELKPASWEDAIELVAKKFKKIKKENGPDAIGGLASAKVTNEENYIFQKFIRSVIGTNNVDHCARLCHASTVVGLASAFGSGAMTNNIAEIDKAEVALIIGSNTTEAHPVIGSYIKRAARQGKTKLIVVDPKWIELADFAEIYVNQRCGSDVAFLNGIMHIMIENGWYDKDYVKERCENFDELKTEVKKYTPEKVSKLTNISVKDLNAIAKMFGQAKTAAVFYSMGITQHTTGTDNVWSVANLQMLCGNIGIPGGGVNALRGQANVQGACDMGALPNVYPGYQPVNNPQAQEKFEKAWGVKLANKVGLTVTEQLKYAGEGKIKALYIMGENPVLSDPDMNHVKEALEKTEFLVVQDIFLTETATIADVVFPAASFAEKDGLFTNTERRVQRLNKAVASPGEAKEDWIIVQDLANAMGAKWKYQTACDIQEELVTVTPQYGGISWKRVGTKGLQWPCPNPEHPGTSYLHKDKFARGLGLMKAIPFKEPAELPDDEYPLVLTTGRVLEQFHTGTMTRKTEGLNNLAGPKITISQEDAKKLGIKDGDRVRVISRRGEIETCAEVGEKLIPKGTTFIPFHYIEAAANILTNPALDPVAKIPEFKACAVRVEKI